MAADEVSLARWSNLWQNFVGTTQYIENYNASHVTIAITDYLYILVAASTIHMNPYTSLIVSDNAS